MRPAAAIAPRPESPTNISEKVGSERPLQFCPGLEAHALAGADLDRRARARIAAHARGALADMERAEARNTEFLAFFQFAGDHAGNGIDGFSGIRRFEPDLFERIDECLLAHKTPLLSLDSPSFFRLPFFL